MPAAAPARPEDDYPYLDWLLHVLGWTHEMGLPRLRGHVGRVASLTQAQQHALVADIPSSLVDLPHLQALAATGLGQLQVLGGSVTAADIAEVGSFLSGGPRFLRALAEGPSGSPPPRQQLRSPILTPSLFGQLAAKGWLRPGHGRRRRHLPEPANPLWAVPKSDGIRHRLITDMRRANALLARPPALGLPMLPVLLEGLAAAVSPLADPLAVVWDMRGWFFQLAIAGDLSAMCVVAGPGPGVCGRMLRLPQGLSWAPLCAQRVHVALIQRAALGLAAAPQLAASSWLDNGVVVGPRHAVVEFWAAFTQLCADLGATIKEHTLGLDVPYCGFQFRLRPHSFCWAVAPGLASKLAMPLPAPSTLTPLAVFRLAGLALWVAQACLIPLCHFEPILRLMRQVGSLVPVIGWHGPLDVPASWIHLQAFWPLLRQLAATWISAPALGAWPPAQLYTDASDAGWAVVADCPGTSRRSWSAAWTASQQAWHIFQKEAFALLVAGPWVMLQFPPRRWAVHCNNLGLVYCTGRGHSRVPAVSRWLGHFLPLPPQVAAALGLPCTPHQFQATVSWISTEINPADAPSRCPTSEHREKWPAGALSALQAWGERRGGDH